MNNAAIFNKKGVLDMPLDEWQRQLRYFDRRVSVYQACCTVDDRTAASRRDHQYHLDRGHQGEPDNIAYCTAKSGLLNFTRSAAMELVPMASASIA